MVPDKKSGKRPRTHFEVKSSKRLERLFSDIKRIESQMLLTDVDRRGPRLLTGGPELFYELETLRAHILELETQLHENEQCAAIAKAVSPEKTDEVKTHPALLIFDEREQVSHAYRDENVLPLQAENIVAAGLDSAIHAPLTTSGQTIGEMQIEPPSEHNWTQEEAGLTNTVTQQVSLQIQNLRLFATVGRARAGAQAAIRRFKNENWESFLNGIKKTIQLKFNSLQILIISAVILPLVLIVTLVVVPAIFPAMAAETADPVRAMVGPKPVTQLERPSYMMRGTLDQYRFGANDESAEIILNTPGTPLAVPSPALVSAPRISLMFTGDINPGRCITWASLAAKDFTYPFQFVAEKLRSADITIGSLDGAISDQSTPMPCSNSLNLIGPSRMVEGLQFAGFDVISIATNHIKNCGEKGWNCDDRAFQDTIQNLLSAGIQPAGGGNNLQEARAPVIIERNGVRFAFLAINEIEPIVWATENQPGTAPLSAETIESIKADISAARALADVVIVLPQWGSEYVPRPNATQRVWAKEFLDAGATLVVGNHPHVIQPVETFPNGVAFYALGNFVFDQPQRAQRESVVVEAIFNGATLESWHLWPAYTNYYTFQTHWAEGPDGNKIVNRAKTLW
jgi:hypothetical protein